jgi:hypothetical protein
VRSGSTPYRVARACAVSLACVDHGGSIAAMVMLQPGRASPAAGQGQEGRHSTQAYAVRKALLLRMKSALPVRAAVEQQRQWRRCGRRWAVRPCLAAAHPRLQPHLLTRRARNTSGTATQCTRRNDSPPPPPPPRHAPAPRHRHPLQLPLCRCSPTRQRPRPSPSPSRSMWRRCRALHHGSPPRGRLGGCGAGGSTRRRSHRAGSAGRGAAPSGLPPHLPAPAPPAATPAPPARPRWQGMRPRWVIRHRRRPRAAAGQAAGPRRPPAQPPRSTSPSSRGRAPSAQAAAADDSQSGCW